jgi:hypothetical protein
VTAGFSRRTLLYLQHIKFNIINSRVHFLVACCFQDFQLNSMEEVVAAAVAAEGEDTPLEVVHKVQDQVEAYPYVPSYEVGAKWSQTKQEHVLTFAVT